MTRAAGQTHREWALCGCEHVAARGGALAGLREWRQFGAAAGRARHCLCIPHHPSQWLPDNRAVAGPRPATAPGLRVRIAQGPLPRRASPLRCGQNGGGQQPRVHMILGIQLLDTQNRARDADLSRQRNATTPALVDHDSRPCIKQCNELWSRGSGGVCNEAWGAAFPFCQHARSATCARQTKVAMLRNRFGCVITEYAAADFPRRPISRQVALLNYQQRQACESVSL